MTNTPLFERYMTSGFILATIIGFAILIRAVMFSGFVSGDDAAYIARAFANSSVGYDLPYSHWGARSGLVLPTSLLYQMFGVSNLTTVLAPFILSILGVYGAFRLGTLLYNESVGLLSAFLMAIFPMEVLFASQLFPYAFLSCLIGWAGYFFLKSVLTGTTSGFFYSGMLVGLAYTCRITALYVFLFFGLVWLIRRFPFRGLIYIGAGVLLFFAIESFYFYFISGDPFARYDILLGKTAGGDAASSDARTLPLQWWLEPVIRPFFEQEFGFLPPITFFAVSYFVFLKRDPNSILLLVWVISLFLYISYGTTSPVAYKPLRHLPRYLSIIILPTIVISAAWIMTRQKVTASLIVCFLSVASFAMLFIDDSPRITERERRIAEHIKTENLTQIVLSRTIHFDTMFYLGFQHPNPMMLVNSKDRSDGRKRSALVTDVNIEINSLVDVKQGTVLFDPRYRLDNADELPPQTWEKVGQFSKPPTFRTKLLKNALVLKILSFVRDANRLKSLAKVGREDTIQEYRVE